jgi:diguanylate cyclase (GGDEF)-like protein
MHKSLQCLLGNKVLTTADPAAFSFDHSTPLIVGIIDDSPEDAELIVRLLKQCEISCTLSVLLSMDDVELFFQRNDIVHMLLVDYYFGSHSGADIIKKYRALYPTLPCIMLTGRGDETVAAEALRAGATDYLHKDYLTKTGLQKMLLHTQHHWLIQHDLKVQADEITRQASVIDVTSDFIGIIDLGGNIQYLNRSALHMLNVDLFSQAKQINFFSLYKSHNAADFTNDIIPHIIRYESWHDEMELLDMNGGACPVSATMLRLDNHKNQANAIAVIMRDVSKEKRHLQELEYFATHDNLTSLANRFLVERILRQGIEKSKRNNKPLAVLFLDLDNFKTVNDSLGHKVGDNLLVEIANKLTSMLRQTDSVGRIGGDEFVIVMEEYHNFLQPKKLAQRILKNLAFTFNIENSVIKVTTSIGIATYPECGSSTDELIKKADLAMYTAKQSGRQSFRFYSHDLQTQSNEVDHLHQAITKAITHNQFSVTFNPVYNAAGDIVSLASHFYWQQKNGKTYDLYQLADIAKKLNQTVELSLLQIENVLTGYLAYCNRFIDGAKPPVSITLTAAQLSSNNIIDYLVSEAATLAINIEQLNILMTEQDLAVVQHSNSYTLTKIVAFNMSLIIDNYGEHSALPFKTIKELPIKALKINPDTILNELDTEIGYVIDAMIALSKGFKCELIIKNINQKSDLALFADKQGIQFQGAYFTQTMT